MNRETFAKGLMLISVSIPGIELREEVLDAWYELLKDISDEAFEKAVVEVCKTEQFYPGTNLVALLRKHSKPSTEDVHAQAVLAWQTVVTGLQGGRGGAPSSPDDSVLQRCVRSLGGWKELGQVLRSDLHWTRREFIELYQVYAQMAPEAYRGRLPCLLSAGPGNLGGGDRGSQGLAGGLGS